MIFFFNYYSVKRLTATFNILVILWVSDVEIGVSLDSSLKWHL